MANKKEINWEEVKRRIEIGTSARGIAQCLHINIDTFYDRFKEHFGCRFSDYSDGKLECRKENILFIQYVKALQGNTKMLELLGKEWCGQGQTDMVIPPQQNQIDQTDKIMRLEHEIEQLKSNANQSQAK